MAILTRTADQSLAFSEVQAFFGRLYSTDIDGIALENLGSVTQPGTTSVTPVTSFAWPNSNSEVFGRAGFTYTPPTRAPAGDIRATGRIRNTSGATVNLSNAQLEVDVNVTDLPDTGSTFALRVVGPAQTLNTGNSFDFILQGNNTIPGETGRRTLIATTQVGGNGSVTWAHNTEIAVYITSPNASRPFTLTVEAVRFSFTSAELERRRDVLSNYRRGGGIVPGLTYPATGGIAIDSVGSVTHTATQIGSWPGDPPPGTVPVLGQAAGISYHGNSDITLADSFGGRFYNASGNNISLTNARVDVSITVTDFNATNSADVRFLVRIGQPETGNPSTAAFLFASNTPTATPASPTVLLTDQTAFATARQTWTTGTDPTDSSTTANLFFTISNSGVVPPDQRPFTYTVNYMRIRFSGTNEFASTGNINTSIPTDGSILRLSDLRNVDDGEP